MVGAVRVRQFLRFEQAFLCELVGPSPVPCVGIDCLFWAGDDLFERLEAPVEARSHIAAAWSSLAQP